MASLASSRSLGLPWTRQQGPNATDALLARYDAAEGRQAWRGGDQFHHQPQQHRRPLSSLRTTGTPLNAIHETLIEHDRGPDRETAAPTFTPDQPALGSLGQTREEDKQASRDPLVPVSLDSEYARILSYTHSSPSALGRRGDASPLSRLSNLWSPTDSSDSTPSEVFPVGSITSDDGQIRSASVETTPPSLLGGFKINKAKPQPLDLASNKEASTCLLSPPVDISEYRRDSFTFYLPADLRLDSPSPPGVGAGAKQNRPFGSSALLHSPQPRRPSLVLASEHATLADDPYTPCWDVEPLPSSETSLLPVAATQDHKTSLGECFSGEIPPAHANGTRTVPPRRTQAAQDRQAAELEAIFRPRTVNRPALAQPGPAGVVTVASVSTELPVGYPLSPEDVERVAKLHNGRIPSIQQLAPADNARSDKYEPIVNTGNQGPMVVQAGDWRCGVCSFVVSLLSRPPDGLLNSDLPEDPTKPSSSRDRADLETPSTELASPSYLFALLPVRERHRQSLDHPVASRGSPRHAAVVDDLAGQRPGPAVRARAHAHCECSRLHAERGDVPFWYPLGGRPRAGEVRQLPFLARPAVPPCDDGGYPSGADDDDGDFDVYRTLSLPGLLDGHAHVRSSSRSSGAELVRSRFEPEPRQGAADAALFASLSTAAAAIPARLYRARIVVLDAGRLARLGVHPERAERR